jgi:hypothetical protein
MNALPSSVVHDSMVTVKKVVAILFTLALLLAQPLAALNSQAATVGQCCNCHMACCAATDNTTPQPAPAAPAPESAQKVFLSLNLLPFALSFVLPAPDNRVGSKDIATTSASAVPLFQRDCAFLI